MASVFPSSIIVTINRPLDDKSVRANIAGRNAIPMSQRYKGMIVTVQNAGANKPQIFQLQSDNLNDWTEIGGSINTYEHTQTIPSDTWQIQHNLAGRPVTILALNDGGDEIVGQRDMQLSTNNLLIYRFSEPLAGIAYLKL